MNQLANVTVKMTPTSWIIIKAFNSLNYARLHIWMRSFPLRSILGTEHQLRSQIIRGRYFLPKAKCIVRHLCKRWPELSASYHPHSGVKKRLLHCLSPIPCQSLSRLTSSSSTQLSAPVVKQTLCIYVAFARVKMCISAESPPRAREPADSVFINVVWVAVM